MPETKERAVPRARRGANGARGAAPGTGPASPPALPEHPGSSLARLLKIACGAFPRLSSRGRPPLLPSLFSRQWPKRPNVIPPCPSVAECSWREMGHRGPDFGQVTDWVIGNGPRVGERMTWVRRNVLRNQSAGPCV